MHLYLSSYLIGDQGHKLAQLAQGKTALVVSNALDFSNDPGRLRSGMEREIGRLASLGIPAEALDLRDYFVSQDILAGKIASAGMLWVLGGNTFLLRKAMHLSGLDQLIHGMIGDGHFLYGGYSAGICVLSPSLRGIHLADEPEACSHGYEHPTIWEGLGVIDYYIVPHYRCDHFESESMEAVVDYYREHDLPYRAIADGEVILDTTHNREPGLRE
ncbi:Type 1 glutamine amidotransferase-like domain-containing protein [Luteolibacter yonseiensis]|uniref:Type 1 glutamine amidotransferase-like domain-containing protein n=1 Tax=Luteolibacter yonseiensis TaxID=1144680 RepID=A0A934VA24_9BACT|nr:Type 1 glutamine amidotransferase-like domain-containing protein [Luteolibacter yonseiensis]MBK1815768.1 Type 1 glutamine amidotransferase-like domain-containing protein [Luteolibacter yonseiensis]